MIFEDLDSAQLISNHTGDRSGSESEAVVALEHELSTVREHLALFTEELETSNEELETSNEELQATNEELQSANQELNITNAELAEKDEELQVTYAASERNRKFYHSFAEN